MASFKSVDGFYKAVSGWDILIDLSSEPLTHGGATIPEWSNLAEGYKFSTSNKVAKSLPFFASNSIHRPDLISSYQNATDFSEHLQVQSDSLLSDFFKLATASFGAKDTKWYCNIPRKVAVHWVLSGNCKN
ncbi:hypothetical protein BX661DRAFT_170721 [Kickxella alabastrina]|uniref:uncharacterized protein n=1 Tax=Kickxella alabastrina TaxID=61397 RepID=UPI002220C1F0|nr:uncharacterized protein BX661DRAFT_170721 [Kickxella alabastrina]KAI7828271.1 hypothetical protein BX661DRAFT_170721 [Kickxella alabastrina]KAJ1943899.1 hypothetical protein GGF37_002441 [Kickxella alabastrina]